MRYPLANVFTILLSIAITIVVWLYVYRWLCRYWYLGWYTFVNADIKVSNCRSSVLPYLFVTAIQTTTNTRNNLLWRAHTIVTLRCVIFTMERYIINTFALLTKPSSCFIFVVLQWNSVIVVYIRYVNMFIVFQHNMCF